MSERDRRIVYSVCKARAKSPASQAGQVLSNLDLVEAARQKVSVWTQDWSTAPVVATTVANHMYNDVATGRHGIWVAHSQGNFVVAQGIGKLKQPLPQLQQSVCTAVVGLASLVGTSEYGIDAAYVRRLTTKYDVLLQWGLSDRSGAEMVPSAPVMGMDKQHQRYVWDMFEAHEVMANYFRDGTGADKVKGAVDAVLAQCEAIP